MAIIFFILLIHCPFFTYSNDPQNRVCKKSSHLVAQNKTKQFNSLRNHNVKITTLGFSGSYATYLALMKRKGNTSCNFFYLS
jgi:hypothetical protein